MLFNSLEFLVFFVIVTTLYFALPHKWRWSMLLVASCVFYMSFIPIYVLILALLIVIDYFAARMIERTEGRKKRMYLLSSIISVCVVLFIFKYFNFFNANFAALASALHWNYPLWTLQLLLPIGLSFHTFQSLSYVIEVYRGRQKAEHHFGIYALYVMFYPQLVAGPIERPQNLLHQFYEKHEFEYRRVLEGLRRMLWGFFKKVVIADKLAMIVSMVFNNPTQYSGTGLMIASIFFAFQIYCDFSGYTDIALGAANIMGFKLMENFRRPFSAKSIAEFWRRWHISLSSWFQDYVFNPLYFAVSKRRMLKRLNLQTKHIVAFIISIILGEILLGLWHGANWTYVAFGAWHGIFISLYYVTRKWWDRMFGWLRILLTFCIALVGFILFRANSLSDAGYIITHLFQGLTFNIFETGLGTGVLGLAYYIFLIILLEAIQWIIEKKSDITARWPAAAIWPIYLFIIIFILFFGVFDKTSFIYFQF